MLIDTGLGSVTLVNVRRPWGMYAYSPADELCKPAAVSSIDRAKTVKHGSLLTQRVYSTLGPLHVLGSEVPLFHSFFLRGPRGWARA